MASSTAAAAAAEERRRRTEEGEMTTYSKEDLTNDWESKIVRSATAAFRNPAALEKLRQEESLAGWVMVEKFDNARVRFKRPRSARESDYRLPQGTDPYRVYYGINSETLSIVILFVVLGIVGAIVICILAIPLGISTGLFH
jgi:hypothetical protein